MLIMHFKSLLKYYLSPLIFIFSALPIHSVESWDTTDTPNLIDDKLQFLLVNQNQSLSSAEKLQDKTPKSLWTHARKLIKHTLKLRKERELFVRPATPQHFKQPLTIFLTTFNAGGYNPPTSCLENPGGPPPNDSLCHWLDFQGHQPDIVVIGLQEMSSLNIQNYFASTLKTTNKRQDVWLNAIETVLNRSGRQYRRLKYVRLLGLFLVVYQRPDLPVTEVQRSTVNTGFLGRVGNKGSVGLSLQLGDDFRICFLNSHLTAGEHKEDFDERNMDASRIASRMRFKGKTLNEHDVVFWMGDLNYRLSELSISREQVIDKCQTNEFKGLLKYDELSKERLAGRTFADYQEAEINFGPTYKFEPGSNEWDEGEKKRMPAWCDRILFKSSDKLKVEPIENRYESVQSVITSDHKPVRAMFLVKEANN